MTNRLLLLALVGFALFSTPAIASIESVTMRVDGLACPFCAYNIEKRVRTLPGVDRGTRIVTSVEDGTATFEWKKGVVFEPAAARRAVREAGFTPRELYVTSAGSIEIRNPDTDSAPQVYLTDVTSELAVLITRGERADRQESWTQLLDAASGDTTSVRLRVTGLVQQDEPDGAWRVVLHRWSPIDFGASLVADVKELACEQCAKRSMRALDKLDDVIHAHADYETDQVFIWTTSAAPDVGELREQIEALGFEVVSLTPVRDDAASDTGS